MFYVINWATFSQISPLQPNNGSNWEEYETLEEAEASVKEANEHHDRCRDEDINEGRENSIYF